MMADAKWPACDFGMIVVYDVKRFGRIDNDEAGYYRHVLRTHGVEVRYVSENFTGDGTDDLIRPVKQWQAGEESNDLSKVVIRGLVSKATNGNATGNANGWWMGGAPVPSKYSAENKTLLMPLAGSDIGAVHQAAHGLKRIR